MINPHNLLFLITSLFATGKDVGCLKLGITEDSIHITTDQLEMKFTFTVTNCSDSALLFFGFDLDLLPGLNLFLETEKGMVYFNNHIIYDGDVPFRAVPFMLKDGQDNFMRTAIVLRPRQKVESIKTIKLEGYSLKKGAYFLHTTYSSNGELSLANVEKTIQILKTNKAFIFQGRSESNKITVIVD